METLLLVLQLLTLAGLGVGGLLFKHHLSSYLKKKGENLATKEDIEEITKKMEAARVPFATAIEAFKHDLQERSRTFTERQKLYLEFAEASSDVFLSGRGRNEERIRAYHAAYAKISVAAPDDVARAINKHLDVQLIAEATGKIDDLQRALRETYADMILAMRRDAFESDTSLTLQDFRFVTVLPGKSASQRD